MNTNELKIKICTPEGFSVESQVSKLRRYVAAHRDRFATVDEFHKWADGVVKGAMENIARFCYVEITGEV